LTVFRSSGKLAAAVAIAWVTVLMSNTCLGATYVFKPEQNAVYIDQRDPDVNFVDKRGILVASESDENVRTVIRFDLGGWVPDADSIVEAKLNLYHYRGGNYSGWRSVNVYTLTSTFDESTATWNFPWSVPGGDYDVAFVTSADVTEAWENWVEWDVTEIVKNRWSNVADFGFLLRDPIEDMPPPDGPYERFRSRRYEEEAPDQIPYLTVQVGCLTGDANRDGIINVGDVVYLVSYLYRGGPEPDPPEAGDANCDDIANVGDVVFLVSYLYKGGLPPACPGPPG
jgi:hypothetical protein